MHYKNFLLILTSLFMISFFEKVDAKYEKLFFDLSIKSINDEIIYLNKFKGKTILLQQRLANVDLQNNIQVFKTFMRSIKIKD